MKPSHRFSHTPCHNSTDYKLSMYPYLLQERTNSKSGFPPSRSAPSETPGMNPSIHAPTRTMNARMFEGPTDSFRTSTTSTIPSLMCLAARPDQIVAIYQLYWDPAIANYTSNDLRRGAFGKKCLETQPIGSERPDHRLVWRGNLLSREAGDYTPSRYLQSSLLPCALACIAHNYAGSPAESAISSHVFHSLTAASPSMSAWREMRTQYIHKAPVHIFPKGFLSLEANMP